MALVQLYHDVQAHAHPASAGRPVMARDTDTLVLRMNRDQTLALVAEMTRVFAEPGEGEVNLVLENTQHITWKQEVFD